MRQPMPAGVEKDDRKETLLTGVTLAYIARRVRSANGDSPRLMHAVSELVEPNGDPTERARALRASEEVLEPLSRNLLTGYLRGTTNGGEQQAREGATR